MSPASYTEELHRIYSSENERKFYGHPVHYKITAGSREIAQDMIRLLVQALYSNQRILGTRISTIYDMDDDCYEVNDLKHLFERAKGTTVVLEFCGVHGENVVYDPSYKKVAEYASELVLQYSNDVLIIIVEIAGPTGLLSMLMKEFDSTMDIVELAEGKGTREQAMEYLNRLVDESRYTQFRDQSLAEALPAEKEYFKPWEIRESFEAWCKNNLKRKIYRAYDIKPAVLPKEEPKEKTKEANEEEKEKAYDKLQAMVGLKEVKEVIDRIIVSHKMQKVRKEMGLKQETFSYHMLFTGNPGSAKTTVARLLAEILEEEGILSTGDFVECGRSDLVGKYVGWTAKQVKSKFREADGGVLFIDEAYALVDDENSFGDEAINTIVQEMENNRDDVIVIFAGYPEKMLDFLDKNEGLRSRIAFHIDFPDYNAEEMTDILKLMAEEKGYHIDTAIEKKCMDIFADACSQPEFGNGRYVRNLLEQAIMKQSVRVFQETKGKKLDKQALVTMDVSDFEINAIPQKEKKPVIGFVI